MIIFKNNNILYKVEIRYIFIFDLLVIQIKNYKWKTYPKFHSDGIKNS